MRLGPRLRFSRRVALCCALLLPLIALPCCGSDAEGSGQDASKSGKPGAAVSAKKGTRDNPWRIGMSQCNVAEPWRKQMNSDLERAAKERPGVELLIKDASNDSRRQQAQVREFSSLSIDLLLISPKEAVPLTGPVGEAMDQGIPVIVLDRAIMGDKYTCFIGGDNVAIGRAVGRFVAKTLRGKGNIVELMGLQTSVPGHDRHNGFLEGLELSKHPGLRIVASADMKWLEPEARKEMASMLAVHRKIDLVYAHNDPGAHGAYLAARSAERQQEMRFVGVDALSHEGIAYVKQGILDATFLYPTGGKEAIETALAILNGKTVPKKIVLGTRIFTKDNVEDGGAAVK